MSATCLFPLLTQKTHLGFTLLEILIALFVVTLGVTGTMHMQINAFHAQRESHYHNTAQQLAAEMADIMRGNSKQMHSTDNDNIFLRINYQSASGATDKPIGRCHYISSYCTLTESASADINTWLNRIRHELPDGRVRICRDNINTHPNAPLRWDCTPAAHSGIVIKIGWSGPYDDNNFSPDVVLTVAS